MYTFLNINFPRRHREFVSGIQKAPPSVFPLRILPRKAGKGLEKALFSTGFMSVCGGWEGLFAGRPAFSYVRHMKPLSRRSCRRMNCVHYTKKKLLLPLAVIIKYNANVLKANDKQDCLIICRRAGEPAVIRMRRNAHHADHS